MIVHLSRLKDVSHFSKRCMIPVKDFLDPFATGWSEGLPPPPFGVINKLRYGAFESYFKAVGVHIKEMEGKEGEKGTGKGRGG